METKLKSLRQSCLKLSHICQDGNLQSAFSCMDTIWCLYDKILNWSKETANDDARDRFVISKGQATLALYAVLAYAANLKENGSRVYVLTGDGEFCEGTMWETCLFASAKKLDNLCVIIDDNHSVGAMIDMGDMKAKLESFGFDVSKADGHDLAELENAFKGFESNGRPKAVIASTVRGYGSRTLTENDIWFHKAPDKNELEMLCREVQEF